MKIAVVGMGYVGLSNAVLVAQENEVVVLDIADSKVAMLNDGLSPIEDVELSEYLTSKRLNLRVTTKKSDYNNAPQSCWYISISNESW